MKRIYLFSFLFTLSVFFLSCDTPTQPSTDETTTEETSTENSTPVISIENVWKLDSETQYDSSGAVVKVESYPIEYFSAQGNSDPDGDGTDETAYWNIFWEFSNSLHRKYDSVDVTDTGSKTTTIVSTHFPDPIVYYSTYDETYTFSGNTLYTTAGSVTDEWTFNITGETLTLTFTNDYGTPDNTSDDKTFVHVFSLASKNDIISAVDKS